MLVWDYIDEMITKVEVGKQTDPQIKKIKKFALSESLSILSFILH